MHYIYENIQVAAGPDSNYMDKLLSHLKTSSLCYCFQTVDQSRRTHSVREIVQTGSAVVQHFYISIIILIPMQRYTSLVPPIQQITNSSPHTPYVIMGIRTVHTKIDLSWIDLRSISVRFEKVFTLIQIDLSSHLSVHIQIALDLDRSQIDLTHQCERRLTLYCRSLFSPNVTP